MILIGKVVRTLISLEAISLDEAKELYKPGGLFAMEARTEALEKLIDYYKVRASISTVMNKAGLLAHIRDQAAIIGRNRRLVPAKDVWKINESSLLHVRSKNEYRESYKNEATR